MNSIIYVIPNEMLVIRYFVSPNLVHQIRYLLWVKKRYIASHLMMNLHVFMLDYHFLLLLIKEFVKMWSNVCQIEFLSIEMLIGEFVFTLYRTSDKRDLFQVHIIFRHNMANLCVVGTFELWKLSLSVSVGVHVCYRVAKNNSSVIHF